MKNLFGNRDRKNRVAKRSLRMESLEDRMLLAVTAGGDEAAVALIAPAQPTEATVVVSDLTQAALQSAIDGAEAGSTIMFGKSGTISLSSAISINKNITISGENKVTIDAGGNDRIFNVAGSVRWFNLNDIELTGGYAEDDGSDNAGLGGVFLLNSSSSATLVNCSVHGNTADASGGAFYATGKIYLENCQVYDNTASDGGAMFVQGMWNGGAAVINATNTVFYNNRTTSDGGFGGLVENMCGQLKLDNCTVVGTKSGNGAITTWTCTLDSGDAGITYYSAKTEIEDSIIAYNFAGDESGADIFQYYVSYSSRASSEEYSIAQKESMYDNISCTNSIIGLKGEFFVEAPVFDAAGNITNADTVDLTIRSDSAAARYQIGANPTTYTGEEYSDADLIVTTLNDVVDGTDGVVSLREALMYAELGTFADTPAITFAPDLAGGTINLQHGALAINSSVAIIGNDITIDANGGSRIFYAKSYNYQMQTSSLNPSYNTIGECPDHDFSTEYMINVSLANLTITGGKTGVTYYYNGGGGVWADQNVQLAMNNCTVTGNTFVNNTGQAYEQGGGGLAVTHFSTLQMDNCEITDNQVYALRYDGGTVLRGGGVFTASHSVAEITRTLISGNKLTTPNAESDPTAYGSLKSLGGGIYNNGDLAIYRYCTVTDNVVRGAVVDNNGAGVYNAARSNPRDSVNTWAFRIDNSTIKGNVAGDSVVINNGSPAGAGVYNAGYAILISDLVADNVADGGSVTDVNFYSRGARGAGIYNNYLLAVYYCTIAGNVSQMVYYNNGEDVLTPQVLKPYGAGIYNTGAPTFIGSILVDNIARCSTDTSIYSKSDLRQEEDSVADFALNGSLYDLTGVSGSVQNNGSVRRSIAKPLFDDGAYTLPSNSQAVDKIATDSEYYFGFYNWDLRNDPYVRVYNDMQDIGCYEYQPEPAPTPTFECTIDSYAGAYDAAYHTVTVNDTQEGDTVYYSADGVNYSTDVKSYAATGVRTVYVKVTREGYQDWLGSGTVTITQAQLSVSGTTVADKAYDGTTAAEVTLGEVSGIIEGDDVTVTPIAQFPSAEAGSYDLTVRYTLSGAQASNYIAPVSETVSASIYDVASKKITVAVVLSDSAAAATEAADLPASISTAKVGDTVYAQVWILNADGSDVGCTGGYIDLSYTVDSLAKGSYTVSSIYASQADRVNDSTAGLVACFGGCSQAGVNNLAVSQWALLGTYTFTASAEGTAEVAAILPTLNGTHIKGLNLSRAGAGNFEDGDIDFTAVSITVEAGGSEQLAAPTISTGSRGIYVSYGANRHNIQWGAVAHASGYEVQYSTDGSSWASVSASGLSAVITGLTYGADVTYRVRALGTGSYTDSDWSRTKTFNVCPMDINGDGDIAGSDRTIMATSWLAEEGEEGYQYYADINGDGEVSNTDRPFIGQNWNKEAGDDDLVYPRALRAADAAFAGYEAGDLDVDIDVF
ncbi:MAG: hypothetical protein IK105_10050 [Thermoguttaceae bacterium]|nr:hypothetical protein [Thermoguttaceae bacterium]